MSAIQQPSSNAAMAPPALERLRKTLTLFLSILQVPEHRKWVEM